MTLVGSRRHFLPFFVGLACVVGLAIVRKGHDFDIVEIWTFTLHCWYSVTSRGPPSHLKVDTYGWTPPPTASPSLSPDGLDVARQLVFDTSAGSMEPKSTGVGTAGPSSIEAGDQELWTMSNAGHWVSLSFGGETMDIESEWI